jgi:quercetin dioxygenase-like cupin family protein
MKSKLKNLSKVSFPKSKDLGKRLWGQEILLAFIKNKFTFKLLKLKKNRQGGLQFHRKKNEVGYLLKGKLKLFFSEDGKILKKKILTRGSVFHFPPRSIHQEIALTDCEILEISTPYFNDRVRVEEYFNLKANSGLSTTTLNQITKNL